MKVGDLVTGYWKGFFEIVKIERRWEWKDGNTYYAKRANCKTVFDINTCGSEINPLYHLKPMYSAEGKPLKTNKIRACDSFFCKLAKDFIPTEIERLKAIIDNLNKI